MVVQEGKVCTGVNAEYFHISMSSNYFVLVEPCTQGEHVDSCKAVKCLLSGGLTGE